VFTYVHFRHLGELKMRFLFDETYLKRLYVVKMLNVFVLVLEKSTKHTSLPHLLLIKTLFEELSSVCKCTQYVLSITHTARGVCFQNRYQHRKVSWIVSLCIWFETCAVVTFEEFCASVKQVRFMALLFII
jgi:hypothetical protein